MTPTAPRPFRAVALLDRDGTINEEVDYLSDPDHVRLLPGAAEALRILHAEGVALVVTSNQSGVGRGYFSGERLAEINARLVEILAGEGVTLDGLYCATSHPDTPDPRRKPSPGMFEQARRELGLFGLPVFSVGDRWTDVELGVNAGGKGIRVATGHPPEREESWKGARTADLESRGLATHCHDLLEAAHWLLSDLSRREFPADLGFQRKFADIYATARSLDTERSRGRRIVLANGCFDILHGGHVSYLEDARSRGDLLVLATNSNASIGRLKGAGRPILAEPDRLAVLSSLRCIDYLTVFHRDTADDVIRVLHPHVHAKGSDYTAENVPERETSLALGIEIAICGAAKENSARDIIGTVLSRAKEGLL